MHNSPTFLDLSHVEVVDQVMFLYSPNKVVKPCLVECPYRLDGPCAAVWSLYLFLHDTLELCKLLLSVVSCNFVDGLP